MSDPRARHWGLDHETADVDDRAARAESLLAEATSLLSKCSASMQAQTDEIKRLEIDLEAERTVTRTLTAAISRSIASGIDGNGHCGHDATETVSEHVRDAFLPSCEAVGGA